MWVKSEKSLRKAVQCQIAEGNISVAECSSAKERVYLGSGVAAGSQGTHHEAGA